MKKLYLIGAILVAVMILVFAFAQFGSTCVWYVIKGNTKPVLVLLWVAGLGAVMGGLLVLWWNQPKTGSGSADDENGEGGGVE